jgi:hypothetical protein
MKTSIISRLIADLIVFFAFSNEPVVMAQLGPSTSLRQAKLRAIGGHRENQL